MRNNLRIHLAAWLMRAIGNERHSFIAPTAEDTAVKGATLTDAHNGMRKEILTVLNKLLLGQRDEIDADMIECRSSLDVRVDRLRSAIHRSPLLATRPPAPAPDLTSAHGRVVQA